MFIPGFVFVCCGDSGEKNAGLFGVEREAAALRDLKPDISSLDSGVVREALENHVNTYLPFRNFMVRAYNTLDFYLFHHSYMAGGKLCIERDYWMYETFYFDGMIRDIHSPEELCRLASRIKNIEDILKNKYSKRFALVMTPNKAHVYPEFLRHEYQKISREKGDLEYRMLADAINEAGITFVDGEKIAKEMKLSGVQVFPSSGAHWNGYTAWTVMNAVLEKLGIPHAVLLPPIDSKNRQTATDDDLLELANIFPQAWPKNCRYTAVDISSRKGFMPLSLSLEMIGGSFCWTMLDYELKWCPVFKRIDVDFYYYLGGKYAVRKDDFQKEMERGLSYEETELCDVFENDENCLGKISDDERWRESLLSHDVILLECNGNMTTTHIEKFLDRAEKVL